MDLSKKMIKLVQARPAIWDKECVDYRDRTARDAAWGEIYRTLEPEYDSLDTATQTHIRQQITKKWYNIRDAYVKYLKNDKYSGSSSSRNRRRPYIYHELMKFLDPAFGHADAEDPSYSRMVTEDSNMSENDSNLLNSVFVDIDEKSNEASANTSKKSRTICTEDEAVVEQSLVNVLASFMQKEENEDLAFFKSILPCVTRLSEDSKFEFRIRVMKLLKDLRKKDEEGVKLKCEYLDEEFM
ncbi:hypothetical protein EVAR_33130_1 [Eumeta japonica]|uniref:MADF domain-containing protein n=1 Tax=Eumeta variegata TaxID=151549 RepID=A0A4C1YB27_EUMVA|nr:hypothetical protein EVAR_33130_1 [Eumeta japonica]